MIFFKTALILGLVGFWYYHIRSLRQMYEFHTKLNSNKPLLETIPDVVDIIGFLVINLTVIGTYNIL